MRRLLTGTRLYYPFVKVVAFNIMAKVAASNRSFHDSVAQKASQTVVAVAVEAEATSS